MTGWICLYRKIEKNPLWTSEKFTRGQAWVDLILLANHTDGYIIVHGHKIPVKRGQVGWSELRLSERWKWSRSRVRTFIKLLESEQQVIQLKSFKSSIITIVNYDKYQNVNIKKTATEQQEDSKKTATEQQKDTNNNYKQLNNDKQVAGFEKFWSLYGKKHDKKKCLQKWKKLKQSDKDKIFETLPAYIASTPDIQFRKNPSTYLNNESWNDEITINQQQQRLLTEEVRCQ